jgi:hypothetical protein
MSITATLIAFTSGLAAKVRAPPADAELAKAMATCKKLLDQRRDAERANVYLLDRIETLERELAVETNLCSHWRAEAMRLAADNREARERRVGGAVALQQYAQMQQAQYNAMQAQAMAQQAQHAAMQMAYGQGFQQLGVVAQNLLGAQNLDSAHWRDWVCTCIPDRASALRRR